MRFKTRLKVKKGENKRWPCRSLDAPSTAARARIQITRTHYYSS
jgi:hypothetical protein